MNDSQPFVHAAKDTAGVWRDAHDLAEHLRAVAGLASQHAHRFNGSDWARLAGLWYDLGKTLSKDLYSAVGALPPRALVSAPPS